MRKYINSILLTALLLNLPALGSAEVAVPVTGRVLFEDRMPIACESLPCDLSSRIFPVPNATVLVQRLNGKLLLAVRTNRTGSYRLRLPRGRYVFSAPDLYTSRAVYLRKVRHQRVDLKTFVY